MFFDFRLNFHEFFENMLNKVNKTIGILYTLRDTLLTSSLLTIYKLFIEELGNTGGGTENYTAFVNLEDQYPNYLFNIILMLSRPYFTRNANNIPHFKVKQSFKNTFFH